MWFNRGVQKEVRAGLDAVYPRLWRYCVVLTGSRDAADDLAQAVCLKAIEKADQFQTGTHLDRWTFRIAQRAWYNDLRGRKVRTGAGLEPIEEIDLEDNKANPETNILGKEVLTEVMGLPDAQRSTVVLVYVEGYSYKECSEILEVPVGTVMSRLSAARQKIAVKFGSENATK